MSKILVESSASFPANVVVPEDGIDLRTAASVETPLQTLADRSQYQKSRLDPAYAELTAVRTITWPVYLDPVAPQWEWARNTGVNVVEQGMKQNSTSTTDLAFWNMFWIDSRMRIVSVFVEWKGSFGSSHAVLPDNMPVFSCQAIEQNASTATTISSNVTDASPNVGVYDDWHVTSYGGFTPYVVTGRAVLAFRVQGAYGGSATGDMIVRKFGVQAYFDSMVP